MLLRLTLTLNAATNGEAQVLLLLTPNVAATTAVKTLLLLTLSAKCRCCSAGAAANR